MFNLLIIFVVIVQLRHPSIMFSQLGGENNAGDKEEDAPSQGKPETVLSRQNQTSNARQQQKTMHV